MVTWFVCLHYSVVFTVFVMKDANLIWSRLSFFVGWCNALRQKMALLNDINISEEHTKVGVRKLTFATAERTNSEDKKIKTHGWDYLQVSNVRCIFKE